MGKLKIFATLLFSALGIFGANEYYKPRNIRDLLKWKGIKLASDNRAWKSMFFEHQEELKLKGIENENGLWTWCSERFKSTNLDDNQTLEEAKKYCADNATSIMGRIIREGEDIKVIKKDDSEAFSVNYVLTGNSPEVLKLIGFEDNAKPSLKEVSEKLSKWCEEQKRTQITNKEDLDKFGNFKKRCYDRGVKNVAQLLRKQGRKPMTTNEEFEARFKDELKNAPQLIKEIRSILTQRQGELMTAWYYRKKTRAHIGKEALEEEEKKEMERINTIIPNNPSEEDLKKNGWSHYKWWCEKKLRSSLLTEGMYPDTYGVVSYRCTDKKASN